MDMQRMAVILAAFAAGLAVSPVLAAVEDKLAEERAIPHKPLPLWQSRARACGCGAMYALAAGSDKGAGWLVFALLVLSLCWIAAWFDLRYRIIPNELVLCILACGLAFSLAGATGSGIGSSLLGLLIGGGLFIVPVLFGANIGFGDVKLAAAIGMCAGAAGVLYVIAAMGALVFFYTLASRKSPAKAMRELIPMGPFVTVAYMLMLIK